MRRIKLGTTQILSPPVPENDSQNAQVPLASKVPLSNSAQENRQAVEVAKSRLADTQNVNQRMMFNPKEVSIDRNATWQNSEAPSDLVNEKDMSSKKDRSILYNGHAGLGSNE